MKFEFVPMKLEYAHEIKTWKYDGHVKTIYMEPYFDSHIGGKIKGPGGCDGFAVLSNKELVGLYEYYFTDGIMEIGLAISPKLMGKGYGKDLVEQGIRFGIENFNYDGNYIKLTVNIENKAAIRVYKKSGFKKHVTDGEDVEMRLNI